jgi:hypothetical protein
MGVSDAQKSEVHASTDDATTAPSSRAGQASGDAKKDVDRAPNDMTPPGRQQGTDRVSEGHRSGRGSRRPPTASADRDGNVGLLTSQSVGNYPAAIWRALLRPHLLLAGMVMMSSGRKRGVVEAAEEPRHRLPAVLDYRAPRRAAGCGVLWAVMRRRWPVAAPVVALALCLTALPQIPRYARPASRGYRSPDG